MACQAVQRCSKEGYSICLDNKTGAPATYVIEMGELGVFTQSVTVPAASVICYKVLQPPGVPVPIRRLPAIAPYYISGSVHITSILIGTLIRDIIDCSPCPIECTFTCAEDPPCVEPPTPPLLSGLKKLCNESYGCEGG